MNDNEASEFKCPYAIDGSRRIPEHVTILPYKKHYLLSRCPLCDSNEHGMVHHKSNFTEHCKCCGSDEHSFLSWKDNIVEGQVRIACPSCWTDDIDDIFNEQKMSQKYRPDPYKFALAHDFDKSRCNVTLKLCWNQGSGWHMFFGQYRKLMKDVLDICDKENSRLPFKREIRTTEEILDLEDYDERL